MFDLLIKNATVVDGLGGPPVREAVAVSEGKVVARGSDAEGSATRVTDGDGLMLAPGFIDIHTHYDAQVLWDPACSPSLLHGVTTIIAGNCGLTLRAPVMPGDGGFFTRLLAKVEAIPVAALQAGVPFNWKTFADFLDVVEGSTALNVGFLVGHSALRRQVMGTPRRSRGPRPVRSSRCRHFSLRRSRRAVSVSAHRRRSLRSTATGDPRHRSSRTGRSSWLWPKPPVPIPVRASSSSRSRQWTASMRMTVRS